MAPDAVCRQAVEILRRPGAVLLLPTETVYGLVCRAGDHVACRRLFELMRGDITYHFTGIIGRKYVRFSMLD